MNTLRAFTLSLAALSLVACGPGADASYEDVELEGGDEAELQRAARFEVFTVLDERFYFHLLAGNGQKVLRSQGYTTRQGAEAGIASVKTNGVAEARYLMREAVDGASYFVVTAANGEIIAVSEMYANASNAFRGAATVQGLVKAVVAQGPAAAGATRFEQFKGLDGRYYFHLKATNGQIVLQSQGYTTASAAKTGISSVMTNGTSAARFSVLPAADGQYYFVLKAGNGQVIGFGETYASKASAERGVASVVTLLTPAK